MATMLAITFDTQETNRIFESGLVFARDPPAFGFPASDTQPPSLS